MPVNYKNPSNISIGYKNPSNISLGSAGSTGVTLPSGGIISACGGGGGVGSGGSGFSTNISSYTFSHADTDLTIGDNNTNKQKLYIVEPWQSRNPIEVKDGLWISLPSDMISNDEIKTYILDKLIETNPEILIKIGLNVDNIKLVKSEVTLEINRST